MIVESAGGSTSVARYPSIAQAVRERWLGPLETEIGRRWRPRIEASENYHRLNSQDWPYLRDLFVNMLDVTSKGWSTSAATGYSIVTNAAADTYFSNPESWVQAKGGDPNGDISRAFRDIVNTTHRDADTEGIMRKCLICDGWAGFGGHWAYFEQTDDEREEIEPITQQATRVPYVVQQKVCGDFVEPWDLRFDPDGRDWKFKDHKYVIRKYRKTVNEIVALPFATPDGVSMFRTWVTNNRPQDHNYSSKWASEASSMDADPGYIPIDMWEIWDRVTKMVIHIPVGADFDLGIYQWPRAWAKANTFPLTFVAFNWEPGDKDRRRGFYPIPLLRLISQQIENINYYTSMHAEAARSDVIKYLVVEGLVSPDELEKLTNDASRVVVTVDATKFREIFGSAAMISPEQIDLRRLFVQLEANAKGKTFEYEAAIDNELRQIARIIGAGSQDRYGLPESKSATEAAGLIDAMNRRGRMKSELAANKYDEITEKFFLLFKTMQTLPIDYEASVDGFDQTMWKQWTDLAKVRTMNFAFRHRMGSNAPRDPNAERAARNATGQLLLSVYGTEPVKRDAIAKWMLEPQDFRDLRVFDSQATALAMELAKMYAMLAVNHALASDTAFADKKADLGAQLAQSLLSPTQMQQVALSVQQAMTSGEAFSEGGGGGERAGRKPLYEHLGSNPGSLAHQETGGESAFAGAAAAGQGGAAAAGRTNIQ